MPAGDLIVEDYQIELQALLMGALTDYGISPPGIGGLGVTAKTAETSIGGGRGAYAAPEFADAQDLTVPLVILGSSPADAMTLFGALKTAWTPTLVDVELHLQLPGLGHVYWRGRPRGVVPDLRRLPQSTLYGLCTFRALDPVAVTVP